MDTEEAIEWVKDAINDLIVGGIYYPKEADRAGKVVTLLKRGEADNKELKIAKEELKKVWQMWKEFKFKRGDTYAILEQPDKGTIRDDMNNFEQKYFK